MSNSYLSARDLEQRAFLEWFDARYKLEWAKTREAAWQAWLARSELGKALPK